MAAMRKYAIGFCALLAFSPLMPTACTPAPPAQPEADAALKPSQIQEPFHTEQEWIISSICRNAFELLAYASDKKGEPAAASQVTLKEIHGATLTYDVTVTGAHHTAEAKLEWPGSLWSPAAYVPFCQAAAKAFKVSPPASPKSQGNPLHSLLDFSESAIESENKRVS